MQNYKSKEKTTDLKQRSYLFALEVIKLIDQLDKRDFATDIIAKQLLRSATSIGVNIIEAQAGSSKKDFTNFFSHALKSANETRFWLCLLRDSERATPDSVSSILNEATELANILGSSIITLKGKR